MKLNKRVPDKEDNTYTLTALTIQMSSQLDPTLGPATQADAACMKEGASQFLINKFGKRLIN